MEFEDMAQNAQKRDFTPKQRFFVAEYLKDLNATQAAIRAGYSAKNADKIGSELLGKTRIACEIQAAMDKRAEKTGINAETVLNNIQRISKSAEEVGDFGAALKGNELLGKHLKLFTDKLEVSGNVTLESIVGGDEHKA